jgi:dihydroorotase
VRTVPVRFAATLALTLGLGSAAAAEPYDLVVAGGRAIDPESGLDALRHLGIRAGRIEVVSAEPLAGRETLDATGLVVAPGFVDLHAHGQDPTSSALQARDGVTAALDLEIGAHPVPRFFAQRGERAVIHFGVSAGHIPARADLKHGIELVHPPTTLDLARGPRGWFLRTLRRFYQPMGYARDPATPEEVERLVALVAADLDAGGIGVGFGLDYTPGARPEEIRALFALAARRGVPAFVHMRGAVGPSDMSQIDSLLEHARATGVSLHIFHLASSGLARTPAYLARIDAARAGGLDVTTEVYPYTAGSTRIESAFFDPGWEERLGISYGDLQWSETGERLTRESFERYRARGGWVIAHAMTPEIVDAAIAHPGVLIASDGIPFLRGGEHPRGAGTFARVLGRYVRERKLLGLMDALAKMTWLPARRIEAAAPAMRAKGRIRPGADADLTLFDPARVADRASFESSREPSAGIVHVIVAGTFVVRDEALVPGALPGHAILGGALR